MHDYCIFTIMQLPSSLNDFYSENNGNSRVNPKAFYFTNYVHLPMRNISVNLVGDWMTGFEVMIFLFLRILKLLTSI